MMVNRSCPNKRSQLLVQKTKQCDSTKCSTAATHFICIAIVCLLASPVSAKESKMETEIEALIKMQSDAWNAGNLEKFMSGYLQSSDVCFTAGGELVWGYDAINGRYKAKYGNNSAGMGKLSFSGLKITPLGEKNALCIGHWNVEKEDKSSAGGVFSLVLVKSAEGWRILHDHTSVGKNVS